MTFWDAFWFYNQLIWPVYAVLITLLVIGLAVIWWIDRTEKQD